jgi:glycine cleavage system H protein
MPIDPRQTIFYKRARFTSRLPVNHQYGRSHVWLAEESPDFWRVGLTKFATRMLGDLVELRFDTVSGDAVEVGQMIGSIEGFKAVSDLYCIADGEFAGTNPDLQKDPSLLDRDPYDRGWVYRLRGRPPETLLTVSDYIKHLDGIIDRMLNEPQHQEEKSC